MAEKADSRNVTDFEDNLEPLSPDVDYGLKNDDGFDPSKYDFYNPSYRTAGKAFVVRLDEYVCAALNPFLPIMLNGSQEANSDLHQVKRLAPTFLGSL